MAYKFEHPDFLIISAVASTLLELLFSILLVYALAHFSFSMLKSGSLFSISEHGITVKDRDNPMADKK